MRGAVQELSYWNPARKHTWSQRQAKPWDPRAIPEVSRYIIGFPLQYFVEIDPDMNDVDQFQMTVRGQEGNQLKREFLKWLESHREAMLDGKDDVGLFTEWRESLEYYFSTAPVVNPCYQFWLATLTFRKTAMRWWGTHLKEYPNLVLSFKQLVEWLNTELVPCAKQDQSLAAWTKLAFRGDVHDYLAQFDKLTLCYPMSHDMTLQYATEPLGTAFYHSAKRANMHYGQMGMTYRDLRNYIEHYLKELKSGDLKLLTERSVSRGGFGAMAGGSQRNRHQLHQVAAEVAPAEEEAPKRSWKESEPRVRNMPKPASTKVWGDVPKDGSRGPRPKKKFGKGPRPCWVCGSDEHNMYTCPQQKRGSALCRVCGSEAHLVSYLSPALFLGLG